MICFGFKLLGVVYIVNIFWHIVNILSVIDYCLICNIHSKHVLFKFDQPDTGPESDQLYH